MRWMWLVACWLAADASDAAQVIFRCAGVAGEPLFTDVDCPNGHPQTTREVNAIDMALPDAVISTIGQPHRVQSAAAREAHSSAQDDAATRRCEAARDRLDAVRATMRRGYKASSAGRLEARLRDARVRVERDCGH
jgi:hypothetical protein